jgi:hypothetical protein
MEFTTIIFVVITIVIFLKLKKEFGKTSHEDQEREEVINTVLKGQKQRNANKIIDIMPLIQRKTALDQKEEKKDDDFYVKNLELLNNKLKIKVEKDEKFKKILSLMDLSLFLQEADSAVEEVINVFSKNDLETLKKILSKNLYLEFEKTLDLTKNKKQHIRSSIISVIKKEILNMEIKAKLFYVDVMFETEQINFIEDEKGKIISGNKDKIEIIKEVWSFKREMSAKNINWQIIGIVDVK